MSPPEVITLDLLSLGSMLLVGLMGAGHCVGMCGGITAALGFSAEGNRVRWPLLLSYNLGRLVSYGTAGALVGLVGFFGQQYLSLGPLLRTMAATLLILMGLYLADWWRALTWLEKVGQFFWRRLQPLSSGLFRVTHAGKGFLFGMLWGWLPCGLVYTALAYAATATSPLEGSASMLAFGVGTLPAMLAGGAFASQLKGFLQRRALRQSMAVVLILFGVWTLWGVFSHQHRQDTHSSDPAAHHQHGH